MSYFAMYFTVQDELQRREEFDTEIADQLRSWARAETIRYSAEHPRRRVTLCAAMGSLILHVEKGGWIKGDDYQFGSPHEPLEVEFIKKLHDLSCELTGNEAIIASYRLECRGGEVLSELTHW